MTVAAEARHILATCTPSTPRSDVVWAVGVVEANHAIDFYVVPLLVARLAPEHHGMSLECGRFYQASRGHAQVLDTDRAVLATVPWPEVAALVTLDLVGSDLYGRIRAACDARRERAPIVNPTGDRRWWHTAEADQLRAAERAEEAACVALAGEVWARCRPGVAQPGLF